MVDVRARMRITFHSEFNKTPLCATFINIVRVTYAYHKCLHLATNYHILTDDVVKQPNDSASCHCTPKCERNIYRATVSHAGVSKAMLRAESVRVVSSTYAQSANRLEDYVIMYKTNRSWAAKLYQLSNWYKGSRKHIFDITTKLDAFTEGLNWITLEEPPRLCILTALDLMNDITLDFSVWEKNTFYLNLSSTLYYENFISHAANDIVRGLEELDGFVSGFIHHLQRFKIAAENSFRCNETSWEVLSQEIQNDVQHANNSILAFDEEYKLLSQIVTINQNIRLYQYPTDDSSEEYIRWAIAIANGLCRLVGVIWPYQW